MSCPGRIEPLQLPITNVTVSDDERTSYYGIQFLVGNPKRPVALLPSTSGRDIFLKNAADCNGTTDNQCVGANGGVYDPEGSQSFSQFQQSRWNGTRTFETREDTIYFNDDLIFADDGRGHVNRTYGFPMYTNAPDGDPPCLANCLGRPLEPWSPIYPGALGLNIGSSFLDTAVSLKQAPSRSIGIWPGSLSPSSPQPGLLVIGGYDSARVAGNFTSFPYDVDCPTCLNIKSMTFAHNGATHELLGPDEPRRIRLDPYWRDLMVPTSMLDRFKNVTNAYFAHGPGMHWAVDEVPLGQIQVEFEGGYRTVIEPEDFFQRRAYYNEDGQLENALGEDLIWARMDNFTNNFTTSHWTPQWGMPLLTGNYLFLDHEKKEFKLAPAVRGSVEGGPVLEAVCSTEEGRDGGSSTGAIAGGVVGGVAAMALVLLAVWWVWWRRRKGAGGGVSTKGSDGGESEEGLKNGAKMAEISGASERRELDGLPVKSALEMASPEQMNGSIVGQLRRARGRIQTATTGISSLSPESVAGPGVQEMAGTIPEEKFAGIKTEREAVELPAGDVEKKL